MTTPTSQSKNQSMRSTPQKSLWALFLVYALCDAAGLAKVFSGKPFWLVMTYVPLLLVLAHSFLTLSVRRGLAFIVLAATVGFGAEWLGLRYGTVFGGRYTYPASTAVLGVPISIVTYWVIFIYMVYWLSTTFLYWLGKSKPQKGRQSHVTLACFVIADGLAVTALDLFMDPVKVRAGAWHWVNGGHYYGIPIGNFIGWFFVTVLVTGVFRLFEYYRPHKKQKLSPAVYLIPVLGYLLTGVAFLAAAISYRLFSLAVVGTAIMLIPALVNLVLFERFRVRKIFVLPSDD